MIADDEHLHKPRGRLVYHIELVGLLALPLASTLTPALNRSLILTPTLALVS